MEVPASTWCCSNCATPKHIAASREGLANLAYCRKNLLYQQVRSIPRGVRVSKHLKPLGATAEDLPYPPTVIQAFRFLDGLRKSENEELDSLVEGRGSVLQGLD